MTGRLISAYYTHQPNEPFFDYGGVKMKENLNKLKQCNKQPGL
jgi:hypothetical protein